MQYILTVTYNYQLWTSAAKHKSYLQSAEMRYLKANREEDQKL